MRFEFFMPNFRGVPVKQQNVYAEIVRDNFWVDFHISKVMYEKDLQRMQNFSMRLAVTYVRALRATVLPSWPLHAWRWPQRPRASSL